MGEALHNSTANIISDTFKLNEAALSLEPITAVMD